MAYTAKTWVDNSAPSVCAANLNDLETGVADAHTTADRAVGKGVLQAKGDLFAALSASSPTRVVVGADNTVLVADAAQTHGLKWVQIGNAQVLAAAAIAYSKLNLASSIVNADVAAGAAIAKSKLAALAVSDSDVAAGAAIAYSKLALAGSIVNADIASSASISAPKIAGFPSDSAKFLRGDATWAAPAAGNTIYVKTSVKDITNTTTKTDLLNGEITIGANVLSASGLIEISLSGDFLWNIAAGGPDNGPEITLGGTILCDPLWANAIAANANRRAWWLSATIQALGATNSQYCSALFVIGGDGAATSGLSQAEVASSGTFHVAAFSDDAASAIDMTAAAALAVNWKWGSASTSLSIRLLRAWIEVKNP